MTTYSKLKKQYGNPLYYYDDGHFLEKKLKGDFTDWKIKTMLFVPYEKEEIKWNNNNIWKEEKRVVKLLDFSTIIGFEGEYIYLVFSRVIK